MGDDARMSYGPSKLEIWLAPRPNRQTDELS